jgi:hypothetical protein
LASHMESFILGSECWKFGSPDMDWPIWVFCLGQQSGLFSGLAYTSFVHNIQPLLQLKMHSWLTLLDAHNFKMQAVCIPVRYITGSSLIQMNQSYIRRPDRIWIARITWWKAPTVTSHVLYRVIKKSLCPWWLQHRKLQVMFKLSPTSLQTFIDTPNCVWQTVFTNSTVCIANVFCDVHLQIINSVEIVQIHWLLHCTETFWSPCISKKLQKVVLLSA